MRPLNVSRTQLLIGILAIQALLPGCSSNLGRFDVLRTKNSNNLYITRAEVADQGSGDSSSVVGPGGHEVTRTTVGGWYLRGNYVDNGNTVADTQKTLAPGLFGNPRATW